MKLENVVPWGRSFTEYQSMFVLTESDLKKNILGCSDGPASFNAELTRQGGKVISVDPIYEFSTSEIEDRIDTVYTDIMQQLELTTDRYLWDKITSIEELGTLRM